MDEKTRLDKKQFFLLTFFQLEAFIAVRKGVKISFHFRPIILTPFLSLILQ